MVKLYPLLRFPDTIEAMLEIPLFPLNTVLFPGMPLQLHIFEERYKQMVRFCRLTNLPFGVVLIKQGLEANGPPAQPHEFGCVAQISQLEPLSEGRFNLLAVGQQRFRIVEIKQDRPYLVGVVENQPLLTLDLSGAMAAAVRLRPWLERYVRMLAEGNEVETILARIPDEPEVLAYMAAVVLQVPPAQKQLFLEIGDSQNLLEELQSRYRREVALVRRILGAQPPEGIGRFSVN